MRHALTGPRLLGALLGIAVWLTTAGTPAHGQHHQGGAPYPQCASPVPRYPCPAPDLTRPADPLSQPPTPQPQAEAPTPIPDQPSLPSEQGPTVGSESVAYMLGNQLGIAGIAFLTPLEAAQRSIVPTVRSFNIAENESPQPRNRFYFTFNYFNDINEAVNSRLGDLVSNMRAYRYTFGVEKTVLGSNGSVGLRVPINNLSTNSQIAVIDGTDTDFGDLTLILKYAPFYNQETGNLASIGLAVTFPTGADSFAGSPAVIPIHSTVFQPYVGYIWNMDRFFLHGFSSISVPNRSDDVTLLNNDIGAGYFLVRSRSSDQLITAVVPTFEVHVRNPLNHRGALDFTDPVGTPDVVSLTYGVTVEVGGTATFAVGLVTPVTGPRPFDLEVLAQMNYRFGRTRYQGATPSILGN